MKKILKIVGLLLLIVSASIVWFFTIPRSVGCLDGAKFTGIRYLEIKSGYFEPKGLSTTEAANVERELSSWWAKYDNGWTPSFVSYAPGLVIDTDKGRINFLKSRLVLGCSGMQYDRRLNAEEAKIFETIKNTISKWKPIK